MPVRCCASRRRSESSRLSWPSSSSVGSLSSPCRSSRNCSTSLQSTQEPLDASGITAAMTWPPFRVYVLKGAASTRPDGNLQPRSRFRATTRPRRAGTHSRGEAAGCMRRTTACGGSANGRDRRLRGPLWRAVLVVAQDLFELVRRFRLQLGVEVGQPPAFPAHDRRHARPHDCDAVLLAEPVAVRLRARVAPRWALGHERVAEAAATRVRGDGGVVPPPLAVARVEAVDVDVARPAITDPSRWRPRPVHGLAVVRQSPEETLLAPA